MIFKCAVGKKTGSGTPMMPTSSPITMIGMSVPALTGATTVALQAPFVARSHLGVLLHQGQKTTL